MPTAWTAWSGCAGRPVRLSGLPGAQGLAIGRRAIQVRRVRCAGLRHRRNDLRPNAVPLTLWFSACWLFAIGKDGIAALSLKRTLDVGSYQTVWAMLRWLRAVLVRPGGASARSALWRSTRPTSAVEIQVLAAAEVVATRC
jgi:hypothetical protein